MRCVMMCMHMCRVCYCVIITCHVMSMLCAHTCIHVMHQWDHLLHTDFFLTDVAALEQWRWIIARIVAEDKHALTSLLERSGPASYATSVFTSHDTEMRERARYMKRLAFVLHAGRKDQYARHLSTILTIIVEALKLQGAAGLQIQVRQGACSMLHVRGMHVCVAVFV